MTRIDIYTPEVYPTLQCWWKGHGWPAIPEAVLPKLGAICYVNDVPVAASFVHMDNSNPCCLLEWTVGNPESSPRTVARAIEVVVDFLKSEAKRMNYTLMFTSCKQESISRLLQRCGFQVTDREMIHHITTL